MNNLEAAQFFIKKIIKTLIFQFSRRSIYRELDIFPFNHNKPLSKEVDHKLPLLCGILESLGISYRLSDGTALGLYRQGGFIPHDNDVDVDILDCKSPGLVEKSLSSLKMIVGRRVLYKGKVQQLAYYDNCELVFDIIFWYSDGDKIYNYSERGYKRVQEKKFFFNLDKITYQGRKYPIPSHMEEWLVMRFGEDWRVPKSYKGDWKEECGDLIKLA